MILQVSMYKSTVLLILLAVMVPSSGSAWAATWTGAGDGIDWNDANNWDTFSVPGPVEEALFNPPPELGPIIWGEVEVGTIHGPKWSSDSNQVMDVATGNLTVNGEWRFANGGSGTAIVNVSGDPNITINGAWRASNSVSDYSIINIAGATISCDWFRIGDDGGGQINIIAGTLNIAGKMDFTARQARPILFKMTGGSVNIGGALQAPGHTNGSGAVTIQLDAGTLRCGSFTHEGARYLIHNLFVVEARCIPSYRPYPLST